MAGITLAQAQTQLQKYLDAEAAILTGQKYEINGRMLMRADLKSVQDGIELWNRRVQSMSSTTGRVVSVRPGW